MGKNFDSKFETRIPFWFFGVLLLPVSILIVGLFWNQSVREENLSRTEQLGSIVNLAGRQRMLSNQMLNNILLLKLSMQHEAPVNMTEADFHRAVDRIGVELGEKHGLLRSRVLADDRLAGSTGLVALLDEATPSIEVLSGVSQMLDEAGQPSAELTASVHAAKEALTSQMDKFNKEVAIRYTSSLEVAQAYQSKVTAVGIGSLIGVTFLSIIPLMRRLTGQNSNLKKFSREFQRLSMVAERTTNAVFITDSRRKITWVNRSFEKVMHQRSDEVLGKYADQLLKVGSINEEVDSRISEAFNDLSGIRCDIHKRLIDGRELFLDLDLQPLLSADGKSEGFIAVLIDDTKEKLALTDLKRSEQALLNTAQIAKVGWWDLELSTNKLYWSDLVRKIHEVPASFKPNVDVAISFFPGEARERITECVRRAIEDKEAYDIELPFLTAKGGRRWVRAMGWPEVENGRVVKISGAFQDITKQVQQSKDLEGERIRFFADVA